MTTNFDLLGQDSTVQSACLSVVMCGWHVGGRGPHWASCSGDHSRCGGCEASSRVGSRVPAVQHWTGAQPGEAAQYAEVRLWHGHGSGAYPPHHFCSVSMDSPHHFCCVTTDPPRHFCYWSHPELMHLPRLAASHLGQRQVRQDVLAVCICSKHK